MKSFGIDLGSSTRACSGSLMIGPPPRPRSPVLEPVANEMLEMYNSC